ncbi:hypothetical protein P832_01999 [Enterobacter kobei]|uniref:hypothetical protein n=1 Tax=Enterobacter kobei TaxID=208224 RepID=UPI00044C2236|nr:hypothetical protein [Enterobacter kobei]EUL86726.1 hypothetical protein P827_01226 [Enterobacter kobei]KDF73756.1 hypothetical protein P832_01999 [Enterobacter kobei]
MSNIDKQAVQAVADLKDGYTLGHADVAILNELARIALASLEAEPVGEVVLGEYDDCGCHPDARVACIAADGQADWENFKDGTRLYTAPPAPVSVPAAMEMDDDFDSAFEHGKAVGWNAYRAAMLQGVDRPQNEPQNIPENIPATQFKPVADLYGLTSPTGGETSFTFDAVEARDFIDGGWSCQEYVELGRYQEALTDHSEDKLAMVDHSGDSNNMVEPVTTACKLRDAVEIIRNSGIAIDAEKIFAERDALNAPDCWCRTCRPVTFSDSRFVVCPECGNKRCPHANDHRNACTGSNEPGQEGSAYPAAPQQE